MGDIIINWSISYDVEREGGIDNFDAVKFFKEVFKVEHVFDDGFDANEFLNGRLFVTEEEFETLWYWMQINGVDAVEYGDVGIRNSDYSGRFEFDGCEFVLTLWDVPVEEVIYT